MATLSVKAAPVLSVGAPQVQAEEQPGMKGGHASVSFRLTCKTPFVPGAIRHGMAWLEGSCSVNLCAVVMNCKATFCHLLEICRCL